MRRLVAVQVDGDPPHAQSPSREELINVLTVEHTSSWGSNTSVRGRADFVTKTVFDKCLTSFTDSRLQELSWGRICVVVESDFEVERCQFMAPETKTGKKNNR